MTTCPDFPLEATGWINEVEIVDALEELKSSRSVSGKNFPNFEMLDAKIPSALRRRRSVSKNRKPQKEDLFLRGRQIAFMIYDYFRVTGAHDTVFDYADFFSVGMG